MTRIQVPPKLRFEVLKRDAFTCKYCGANGNDVLLHVDHIIPVVEGGTNDIINLTTACQPCNAGKGGIKLDDQEMVRQSMSEAQERQARTQQAQEMTKWVLDLNGKNPECEAAVSTFCQLFDVTLHPPGVKIINKLIIKYGLRETLDAITAAQRYSDPGVALEKLPSIAKYKRQAIDNPNLAKAWHVANIVKTTIVGNPWRKRGAVEAIEFFLERSKDEPTAVEVARFIQESDDFKEWDDIIEKFGINEKRSELRRYLQAERMANEPVKKKKRKKKKRRR